MTLCRHPVLCSVLLGMSLLLSACTSLPLTRNDAELKQAYLAAVKDAEQAEPHEISTKLIAITPSNPRLVWKEQDTRNPQVRVATWTNYNGYDDKIHRTMRLSREVWVTAVPEFKDFCTRIRGDKTLRLEQLLGLPPASGKTKVVEMWVNPADLFRPSPDPEISDHEAGVDFPQSSRLAISNSHKAWINQLKSGSYGEKGYPWTRLGYTYDWGQQSGHVGLSEFVIAKGAAVEIAEVAPTAQYCQPH